MVHERAWVESNNIGDGTRIWAWTHIMSGVVIGNNCNIGEHCYIETNVVIGNNVIIKNGVSIWDKVIIKDDVFVGPNAVFTNDLYPRAKSLKPDWIGKETLIDTGATIGANATILCGLRIGKYAMIGAGAVVTKDIPDYGLARGVPARIVGKVDKDGHPINIKL